jgi:F-type H+-transporting ATPase subunit gamma
VTKLLELRQRIRAVENIQTITRTLATVAAAKLARTRRRAAGLREYGERIREILRHQQVRLAPSGAPLGGASPLLEERRPVRNIALLVVTADRGMCGGYNLDVCRHAADVWALRRRALQGVRFVLKGTKGAVYLARRGADVVHREAWAREGIDARGVERLLDALLAPFLSRAVEEVWAVYTEYHSPVRRRSRAIRILPVELPAPGPADEQHERWGYEPSLDEIVDELLPIYLRVQLYGVLLQSYASEQGARMVTMEEASERADRTLQECRVLHHRLRREAITVDLLGALFASGAAAERGAEPPERPA